MASKHVGITVKDFTVDYNHFDGDECRRVFTDYGVCVIQNVFDGAFCDAKVNDIVSFFEGLGTGISRHDETTFCNEKVPYETRTGMYHALVGNLPAVWELRTADAVRKCFSTLYQYDGQFIVSSEGFTLTPNRVYEKTKDWPHLDQTSGGMFKCIQGQAVMTNTTAAFVCSPKSHLLHGEILDLYACPSQFEGSDFLKLDKDAKRLQKRVEKIGGAWQMPIVTSKGSLILWTSALIHSSRLSNKKEAPQDGDPWRGWRCAVYICYRPQYNFSSEEVAARAECLLTNRQTNHWGTKIMDKRAFNYSSNRADKHPLIDTLTDEPLRVYLRTQKPSLHNPRIRELSGVELIDLDSYDGRLLSMIDIYQDPDLSVDEMIKRMVSFTETKQKRERRK